MATLVCQAQASINLRPLQDPGPDQPPITPADFLLSGSHTLTLAPVVDRADLSLRSRRELLQSDVRDSWEYFFTHYLTALQKNYKNTSESTIRAGDLVAIMDAPEHCGLWPVGRVENAHPDPDERGRTLDIKLLSSGQTITRSYRKVARIPKPQPLML